MHKRHFTWLRIHLLRFALRRHAYFLPRNWILHSFTFKNWRSISSQITTHTGTARFTDSQFDSVKVIALEKINFLDIVTRRSFAIEGRNENTDIQLSWDEQLRAWDDKLVSNDWRLISSASYVDTRTLVETTVRFQKSEEAKECPKIRSIQEEIWFHTN